MADDSTYKANLINIVDSLSQYYLNNDVNFDIIANKIYYFQSRFNPIFRQYITHLGKDKESHTYTFLPIEFFKSKFIKSGAWSFKRIFLSSSTTGNSPSRHLVPSLSEYHSNTKFIFESTYGSLSHYCYLCLLPSYLERRSSSLVEMCRFFIQNSKYSQSGFFLYDHEKLHHIIEHNLAFNIPTILIGVSYALLDFAEKHKIENKNSLFKVMKTGGMKGRKQEIQAEELDNILKSSFGVNTIFAEYGMTECFSQLYGFDNAYTQNRMMNIVITDLTDPFKMLEANRTGRINIIDLANYRTCSFIATDDLGQLDQQGRLIHKGRIDHSDIRGCNLLL